MKLGDVIYTYRMEHKQSLREFATACGLSPSQIYFMERGLNSQGDKFTPKAKSLKKVAEGMGITMNELLSVCDDMVMSWDDDDKVSPEKQALIDRVLRMDSVQLDRLSKLLDIVEGK